MQRSGIDRPGAHAAWRVGLALAAVAFNTPLWAMEGSVTGDVANLRTAPGVDEGILLAPDPDL
jgi:hypothetical protein